MKYRLLATAAALALAVSLHPALAQQQSPEQGGGMSRPDSGGPSQHHEQDQGIKSGQLDKGSGGTAGEHSRSTRGTGSAAKSEEPKKKVAQPEKKEGAGQEQDKTKTGAADSDKDNRTASDRDQDRDKNARSTDRERSTKATDRDRDRSTRSSDRNRDQNTKSTDRDRERSRSTAENRSSSTSVTLNAQQKTKISTAIRSARVEPLKNVNFSVRVGTEVPAYVHFYALPTEIAEIVPQYRDYNYVVVQDRIVIIEPRTRKIVTIIDPPRQASRGEGKRHLSSHERKVIKNRTASTRYRPQVREHYTERYVVGERVPDDVEFYDLPEVVYAEEPAIRRYRYIPRDRGVVVVEPRERRVIDVID
jgi:hypothetical protein